LGERMRMAVVASADYIARRGIPEAPLDLLSHDCILYNSAVTGAHQRWKFVRDGREMEIKVSGRVSSNDSATMLHAALQGQGYAYFYDRYVQEHLAAGRLVQVLQDCSPVQNLWLYYFNRDTPQKLRVFIDYLKRELTSD